MKITQILTISIIVLLILSGLQGIWYLYLKTIEGDGITKIIDIDHVTYDEENNQILTISKTRTGITINSYDLNLDEIGKSLSIDNNFSSIYTLSSYNGKYLVFTTLVNYKLIVVNLDTNQIELQFNLVQDENYWTDAYIDDNDRLHFISENNLIIYELPNKTIVRNQSLPFSEDEMDGHVSRWSPTGDYIYMEINESYLLNPTNFTDIQNLHLENLTEKSIKWSSDGSKLAIILGLASQYTKSSIQIMDIKSGVINQAPVSFNGDYQHNGHLVFSNDNSRLFHYFYEQPKFAILNIKSKEVTTDQFSYDYPIVDSDKLIWHNKLKKLIVFDHNSLWSLDLSDENLTKMNLKGSGIFMENVGIFISIELFLVIFIVLTRKTKLL